MRTFPEVLAGRTAAAAGLKSVVAYRFGFDFAPEPPTPAETVAAAGAMLATAGPRGPRVTDPTLLRFLLWSGVDRGLPLQLHCGYGDPDLELHRCDPLLLTRFLRLVEPRGVDVLLLHCYPYHRHAGYLAQVFPHVYFDVGLAVNHTGLGSAAVVAESLELAPFAKILYLVGRVRARRAALPRGAPVAPRPGPRAARLGGRGRGDRRRRRTDRPPDRPRQRAEGVRAGLRDKLRRPILRR